MTTPVMHERFPVALTADGVLRIAPRVWYR
jgi:hypothetical protein